MAIVRRRALYTIMKRLNSYGVLATRIATLFYKISSPTAKVAYEKRKMEKHLSWVIRKPPCSSERPRLRSRGPLGRRERKNGGCLSEASFAVLAREAVKGRRAAKARPNGNYKYPFAGRAWFFRSFLSRKKNKRNMLRTYGAPTPLLPNATNVWLLRSLVLFMLI